MDQRTSALPRAYTPVDDRLAHALECAADFRLVPEGASRSERLRSLALYACERLEADAAFEQQVAAYRELAADPERSAAIKASVLQAVEDGIL